MNFLVGLLSGAVASILVLIGDRVWHALMIRRQLAWIAGEYFIEKGDRGTRIDEELNRFESLQRNVFRVTSNGGPTGDWVAEVTAREEIPSFGFGVFSYVDGDRWGTHQYHFKKKEAKILVYGLNQGQGGPKNLSGSYCLRSQIRMGNSAHWSGWGAVLDCHEGEVRAGARARRVHGERSRYRRLEGTSVSRAQP